MKNTVWRSLVISLLVLVMVSVLFACVGGGNTEDTTIAPSEGSEPLAPETGDTTVADTTVEDPTEPESEPETEPDDRLTVNKTTFEVGESIIVTAYGKGTDWVGIQSLENYEAQQGDCFWWYVTTIGSGTPFDMQTEFDEAKKAVELPAGEYIIRLMHNEGVSGNTCIDEVRIVIGNPEKPEPETEPEDYLTVNKTAFEVGESIIVTAYGKGTDWVGIQRVENFEAQHGDCFWWYVTTIGSGTPFDMQKDFDEANKAVDLSAGEYIIRLIPNDGVFYGECIDEIRVVIGSSENIETEPVTDPEPDPDPEEPDRLTVNKTAFEVGEDILVTAIGSGTDWVGIQRVEFFEAQNGDCFWWYVSAIGSGAQFNMQADVDGSNKAVDLPEGEYIIRLIPNDGVFYGECIDEIRVVIGDPENIETEPVTEPEPEPEPEEPDRLTVNKTTFKVGEEILVTAIGSGTDWVAIMSKADLDGVTGNYSAWTYVESVSGTPFDMLQLLNGGELPAGEYIIRLLPNDGGFYGTYIDEVRIVIENTDGENTETPEIDYLTVNKTTFTVGEEILVTAIGDGTDWVGIAALSSYQAGAGSLYYWYVTDVGSGTSCDLLTLYGNSLPAGEYIIRLIADDQGFQAGSIDEITITITE